MFRPRIRAAPPQLRGAARRGVISALAVGTIAALLVSSGPAGAAPREEASTRHPGSKFWSALQAIPTARDPITRSFIHPSRYRAYSLDRAGMKARLALAPREFTTAADTGPMVLSLPSPSGGFARFTVQESPIVAPELGARYPFIKTYSGQGVDDPAATIRFDLGLMGFHAQVLSPHGDWYIDPYYSLNQSVYVSYFIRDLANSHGRFVEHGVLGSLPPAKAVSKGSSHWVVGSELRTYRLALAADGEYSQFQGGTVPLVHNALVVLVNRITGVYERELAIRLQLVANNDSLIYLNPATDPYTNSNAGALLSQNQSTIDSVIGNANYDVGHVLTTGGGGLSAVAVVGRAGQKARSETGGPSPTGDAFYIDYVAHEMGHEFGANHSFSGIQGSCAGNGNLSTAIEPGSGTTIMDYAGICGLDDLQPHSDDYFSPASFDEIAAYTTTAGSPGNIGAAPSGNTPPTVTVNGSGPFTVPIRTPFALSATGTDANGDTLSYDWAQIDGGALRALNDPSKPTGALFRSFPPTTNQTRVFPRMSGVLANATDANTGTCPALPGGLVCWSEFLPTIARPMNFRVTVRDNNVAAGGVNSSNVVVNAAGSAPFLVTSPNIAVSLPGGSAQTVTWNVVGTNAAPYNASNVTIVLSTDGGATFPTTLLASTPNDGSQSVTLPNLSTTQARIQIQAVGNIFFDVSDANFTITGGGGGGGSDVFPSTVTAQSGTITSGDASSLTADDDVYLVVTSTTQKGTKTATWYGSFTGVDNAVASLDATYRGKSSLTCTQVIWIWRWTDQSWVQLDSRSVGTAEVEVAGLTPAGTLADFVSGTTGPGEVRVRISCAIATPFVLSADLLRLQVGGTGGGSDVFPSTVTAQSGTITSGDASSLTADDDVYLVVTSTTQKGTKTATWYGSFTGVDNAVASLDATYRGKSSLTCTQVIWIWRWTDQSWVQLDSRSVGTAEVEVAGLTPAGTLADFVSGTTGPGEVRVRISCAIATPFVLSADLLKVTTSA